MHRHSSGDIQMADVDHDSDHGVRLSSHTNPAFALDGLDAVHWSEEMMEKKDGHSKFGMPTTDSHLQKYTPEVAFEMDTTTRERLLYNITDSPPIYLTVLLAIQQSLLSLAGSLAVSLLVSEVVCASKDDNFKAKLLSSTLFMNGITTLAMNTIGIRLPLFQGAAADYVVPLLAMAAIDSERCGIEVASTLNATGRHMDNISDADMFEIKRGVILESTASLQGSLIVAGVIHFLVGATGAVGLLLRFVGPVTIVPTILLIGIYIVRATTTFAQAHWGIAFLTCAIAITMSLYLGHYPMPIPVWTRSKGCHVIRYPLHQVFAILISIAIGWIFSWILTECGVFTSDPNADEYMARTDARNHVVTTATWFHFPYPGQFGTPSFSAGAFVGFLVGTVTSILDSVGDYYACASMCNVPAPPPHAVNRGIAIEGLCSAISGAVGCGHATSTYGGNIGAIGITKVASRRVFLGVALIYIVFGMIGKLSAVFITIPYPVLGGALMTMFGMFTGVVLSNLRVVSLVSNRNLAIIGTSIFVGLMVPYWVESHPKGINTGNASADYVITMLIGNPNLCGGVLACFMDNTIKGTREERGIAAWQDPDTSNDTEYENGLEVYMPLLPKRLLSSRFLKYIPFLPNPQDPEKPGVIAA